MSGLPFVVYIPRYIPLEILRLFAALAFGIAVAHP
jgi:hypothetical protein